MRWLVVLCGLLSAVTASAQVDIAKIKNDPQYVWAEGFGATSDEADADALEQRLEETLEQLRRCAPNANAATKALLLASESGELGALLDDAARQFAEAVGGAEGSEGTLAFVQKRKPVWAQ